MDCLERWSLVEPIQKLSPNERVNEESVRAAYEKRDAFIGNLISTSMGMVSIPTIEIFSNAFLRDFAHDYPEFILFKSVPDGLAEPIPCYFINLQRLGVKRVFDGCAVLDVFKRELKASRSLFVTTGDFSEIEVIILKNNSQEFINGDQIATLMKETGARL